MTAVSSHQEGETRKPRLATRPHPRLSLIVAADVSRQWLDSLLATVPRQLGPDVVEVLVVRAASPRSDFERTPRHSHVRFVTAPAGAEVGELRANGLRQASGDLVLLLDSDRPVEPGMIARLMELSSNGGVPEWDLRA